MRTRRPLQTFEVHNPLVGVNALSGAVVEARKRPVQAHSTLAMAQKRVGKNGSLCAQTCVLLTRYRFRGTVRNKERFQHDKAQGHARNASRGRVRGFRASWCKLDRTCVYAACNCEQKNDDAHRVTSRSLKLAITVKNRVGSTPWCWCLSRTASTASPFKLAVLDWLRPRTRRVRQETPKRTFSQLCCSGS